MELHAHGVDAVALVSGSHALTFKLQGRNDAVMGRHAAKKDEEN